MNYLELGLYAILASFLALSGGVVFLYSKSLSKKLSRHAIPFAAGVLLTVSLIGLLPEAVDMTGEQAFLIVLLSFFGAYFFEHFLFGIHHHDTHNHGHEYKSSVILVIVGDTIHNFIDGLTIGATYLVNPGLAFITTISTFLHEVPHEIGDFGILLKAGWKKTHILIVNIVSASTTLLGAFAALFIAQDPETIGVLLAVSAGIFLYLGAIDFLPNIFHDHDHGVSPIIPLLLGIIIMMGTLYAIPHEHEHDEDPSITEIHMEGEFIPESDHLLYE